MWLAATVPRGTPRPLFQANPPRRAVVVAAAKEPMSEPTKQPTIPQK